MSRRDKLRILVGSSATIGDRYRMEDVLVIRPGADYLHCALYDGHCGRAAAELAAPIIAAAGQQKVAVLLAFEQVQAACERRRIDAGTTALIANINRETGTGYVANLGDSRALLVSATDVYQVTRDHRPADQIEREYILEHGGTVTWYGCPRVNGILAVSRALGDVDLIGVNHVPEFHNVELTDTNTLVLACDGVWDVLSNDEVAAIVRGQWTNVSDVAVAIKNMALAAGSSDNISVVVIRRA